MQDWYVCLHVRFHIIVFFHVLFDVFVINIYIPRHILSKWLSNRFGWSSFRWWGYDFILQMGSCAILLTVARVGWNKPGSVTKTGKKDDICGIWCRWITWDSCICNPKRDPVRFPKQWPELFKSGRVLSLETVGGLTFIDWDIVSAVWSHCLDTKGCGHADRGATCDLLWYVNNSQYILYL